MSNYPDEFDKLHKALVADASKHPDYGQRPSVALLGYSEGAEHALDTIRIKGYVLHRKVSTIEELEAIGFGAAVLDSRGTVWVNDGDSLDQWASLLENSQGGPIWRCSADIELPATVLYEAY